MKTVPPGLFSVGTADDAVLVAQRRALLQKWSADPWAFLTGKDTDGTPVIWTKDERSDEAYRPFPSDKLYLKALLRELFGPQQIILVDKSRQMMVSTLCCLALMHHVLFRRGRRCFISKQTEEEAVMLLEDKIKGVYRRTPGWFRDALPLKLEPANVATATRTDSEVKAVSQNAATRTFRGNTGSIILIDEAAFQERFPDMLRAAVEMSSRLWAVSTANAGNPGAETFKRLKEER